MSDGKRRRPKIRWLDVVNDNDLEALEVQKWKEVVQDRYKWRDIVKAAKTLKDL